MAVVAAGAARQVLRAGEVSQAEVDAALQRGEPVIFDEDEDCEHGPENPEAEWAEAAAQMVAAAGGSSAAGGGTWGA